MVIAAKNGKSGNYRIALVADDDDLVQQVTLLREHLDTRVAAVGDVEARLRAAVCWSSCRSGDLAARPAGGSACR